MHRPTSRRAFLLTTAAAAPLAARVESADVASDQSQGVSRPRASMGLLVGEVTQTSALVQARLCVSEGLVDGDVPGAPGVVEFSLYPVDGPPTAPGKTVEALTQTAEAVAERDFIARTAFTGLLPGTRYVCETRVGLAKNALHPGPRARFRTLPEPAVAEEVRIVVAACMNYGKFHGDPRIDRAMHVAKNNTELAPPYSGADAHLGYPALEAILALRPDFFVGTGDNVYYDTPEVGRAESPSAMRQKWHEQFVQQRFVDLFAAVPTYWETDDHDYRIDDGDNAGDFNPSSAVAQQLMFEQLPYAPAGAKDPRSYRTHRFGRDLQIWLTEGRMYRSPNATPDGPGKTLWGREQRDWLQRTLLESDATFKLLISPTPLIGPDDARKFDNHCNIGGFQHERDDFFRFLKEHKIDQQGFAILCGDRHWQYHSIHPTGIEELGCGAIVDENSRPGRKPGDPASTDPQATIRQPYLQTPPSGGYLVVHVVPSTPDAPARLTFRHFNSRGRKLYEYRKPGSPRAV